MIIFRFPSPRQPVDWLSMTSVFMTIRRQDPPLHLIVEICVWNKRLKHRTYCRLIDTSDPALDTIEGHKATIHEIKHEAEAIELEMMQEAS